MQEEEALGVAGKMKLCRQVVFSCGEEKCGKAPLYFFNKVMMGFF